jgi:hypothetical protein
LRLQSGLSGAIWALNNLLLGAHTAAALSLISAGRTATSAVTLRATDPVRHAACAAFIALTLAISAFTWQGWPSALLLVASLLSTFATFYLRATSLRLTMLPVSALWMVNAWVFWFLGADAGQRSHRARRNLRRAAQRWRYSSSSATNIDSTFSRSRLSQLTCGSLR